MGNNSGKSKIKVKVKASKKNKAVKPKFGSKNGGLLTARIVATVNKNKMNSNG